MLVSFILTLVLSETIDDERELIEIYVYNEFVAFLR